MSYRVRIHGIEVSCDTATEAVVLAKHAGGAPTPGSKSADGVGKQRSGERRIKHVSRSLRFLAAVRDAGEQGTGGSALVRVVGCNGPYGLGTIVQQTREFLRTAELELEAVAKKVRVGDQKKWLAGQKIEEGIRVLQEIVNDG